MSFQFDQELDCSGMACPMPILKTKKAVDALLTGQVLKFVNSSYFGFSHRISNVKQAIAPYKYPRSIKFITELPNTATGKVQRFRLRQSP